MARSSPSPSSGSARRSRVSGTVRPSGIVNERSTSGAGPASRTSITSRDGAVVAQLVGAGLERPAAVDAEVPAPHEVAGDDALVGEELADVVGGRALGDDDLPRLAGRSRRVDLLLDPPQGASRRQRQDDEEDQEDREDPPAARGLSAQLDVLVLVLVRSYCSYCSYWSGSSYGSRTSSTTSASRSASCSRRVLGRSSRGVLRAGAEAAVVEPGLQHDRRGHLVDNPSPGAGLHVQGHQVPVGGDGGEALVPHLHRQPGGRGQLIRLVQRRRRRPRRPTRRATAEGRRRAPRRRSPRPGRRWRGGPRARSPERATTS